VLTPVYLMNQGIDTSASLSCVLGIQSIEFLVKVLGGALALVFLLNQMSMTRELFWTGLIGIGLMLLGGFMLAAIIWSPRAAALIRRIAGSKSLGRFTAGVMAKLEEFSENEMKSRSGIPEIALISTRSSPGKVYCL